MKGSFHLGWAAWSDVNIALDSDVGGLRGIIQAVSFVITLTRSVGICTLKHDIVASLLKVFEGVVLKTTVATQVTIPSGGAVNKLLLREGQKLSRGDKVGTLEGTSG